MVKAMIKSHKVLLISITAVLALVFAWFLFTASIRSEFKSHLSKTYPEQKFNMGFVKFEPIYGNYFADVTCLDDSISFRVSKNNYTKVISDYYSGAKRVSQYNSKIKAIFNSSDLKNAIRDVSGWGSSPYKDDGVYDQISLVITENIDLISFATKTIALLKENNISAEIVGILQEKDNRVYEIRLSPADYSLSKSELEAKIERRK